MQVQARTQFSVHLDSIKSMKSNFAVCHGVTILSREPDGTHGGAEWQDDLFARNHIDILISPWLFLCNMPNDLHELFEQVWMFVLSARENKPRCQVTERATCSCCVVLGDGLSVGGGVRDKNWYKYVSSSEKRAAQKRWVWLLHYCHILACNVSLLATIHLGGSSSLNRLNRPYSQQPFFWKK